MSNFTSQGHGGVTSYYRMRHQKPLDPGSCLTWMAGSHFVTLLNLLGLAQHHLGCLTHVRPPCAWCASPYSATHIPHRPHARTTQLNSTTMNTSSFVVALMLALIAPVSASKAARQLRVSAVYKAPLSCCLQSR